MRLAKPQVRPRLDEVRFPEWLEWVPWDDARPGETALANIRRTNTWDAVVSGWIRFDVVGESR